MAQPLYVWPGRGRVVVVVVRAGVVEPDVGVQG